MTQTLKEFAYFNVPLHRDAAIDPADSWLFSEPIHVFPIHTQESRVLDDYEVIRKRGPRRIGLGNIETRVILKVRLVHYSNWTKVTGVDANR